MKLIVVDKNSINNKGITFVLPTILIKSKVFWKFVSTLMQNKHWINNGNAIKETKFEMCKELVKLVNDYVEKI